VINGIQSVDQFILWALAAWFGLNLLIGVGIVFLRWLVRRLDARSPKKPEAPVDTWEPVEAEDLLVEKLFAGRIPPQRFFRRLDQRQDAAIEERQAAKVKERR
jgi:hypothetical protein